MLTSSGSVFDVLQMPGILIKLWSILEWQPSYSNISNEFLLMFLPSPLLSAAGDVCLSVCLKASFQWQVSWTVWPLPGLSHSLSLTQLTRTRVKGPSVGHCVCVESVFAHAHTLAAVYSLFQCAAHWIGHQDKLMLLRLQLLLVSRTTVSLMLVFQPHDMIKENIQFLNNPCVYNTLSFQLNRRKTSKIICSTTDKAVRSQGSAKKKKIYNIIFHNT